MALTQIFYDQFIDTDATLLTAHTPDDGINWTPIIGNAGTNAQIDYNGVIGTLVQPFHSGGSSSYYKINAVESETAEQQAEAEFRSATVRLALRLRDGASAASCIVCEFNSGTNNITVASVTNGTYAALGTAGAASELIAGAICRAHVDASNNVRVYINDTLRQIDGADFINATGHNTGAVGIRLVKSYTADGPTQFKAWYDTAAGGVTFVGPIADQTFPEGLVSIPCGDEFTGATSYSSVGTALPGWATLNTSTGEITGTGTDGTTTGVVIRGSDGTTTADSNAFTIDIVPVGELVPQGVTTITGVTTSTVTGNVAWDYTLADETGFEYSLDLGTATPTLSNPHTISDLTPGQTYNVRVRAVNSYGAGAWSDAVEFTTDVDVTITSGVIKNETLTILANTVFPLVTVNTIAGVLVASFTDVTSSPTGVITLTDNVNFVSGTTYRLWYELSSGDWGTAKVVAV